jgi:hypothetical protein
VPAPRKSPKKSSAENAPSPADVLAAAKLSRIPGVTIAEAAKRYGVTAAAIARARRADPHLRLSSDELALAALTRNGAKRRGTLSAGTLTSIAGWIDYVDHDACTADEVRQMLDGWVKSGVLALDGSAWRLLEAWP